MALDFHFSSGSRAIEIISQDYFSTFPSSPFGVDNEASAYSAFVGNEGNVPSYLVGYPGSAGYFMGERGALRKK